MSKRKIEVKVNMHCEKCKTGVLKAVTKLSGIDEVSVQLEKQMLVVIGDVDPVCVVTRVRKIGKIAEIIYVGPVKKPDVKKPDDKKPDDKKPDDKKPDDKKPDDKKPCTNPCTIIYPPPCNDGCRMVVVEYPQSCDSGGCFIL